MPGFHMIVCVVPVARVPEKTCQRPLWHKWFNGNQLFSISDRNDKRETLSLRQTHFYLRDTSDCQQSRFFNGNHCSITTIHMYGNHSITRIVCVTEKMSTDGKDSNYMETIQSLLSLEIFMSLESLRSYGNQS